MNLLVLFVFSCEEGSAAERAQKGKRERARLHSRHITYKLCEQEGGAYLLCASVSLLINGDSRTYLVR